MAVYRRENVRLIADWRAKWSAADEMEAQKAVKLRVARHPHTISLRQKRKLYHIPKATPIYCGKRKFCLRD
jgi:hypothetical protein